MDALIKSDIFFLVATIAVVIVVVLLSVALWNLIRILKNIRRVSDEAVEEVIETRGRIKRLWSRISDSSLGNWLFKSSKKKKSFIKRTGEKSNDN